MSLLLDRLEKAAKMFDARVKERSFALNAPPLSR